MFPLRKTRRCVQIVYRSLLVSALGFVGPATAHSQTSKSNTDRSDPRELPPLPATTSVVPRADAGDDQLGLVGARVTLNGGRSGPRGRIGFRWMQVEGPRVTDQSDDGYIHEFVPSAPGVYRFALVVAADKHISHPDHVTVVVPATHPVPSSTAGSSTWMTPNVETLTTQALASVEGGNEVGGSMAEAFESVAARMELYRSYHDLYAELSRRLESSLPTVPARRQVWIDRVFAPLTQSMVNALRMEDLDLTRPDQQAASLTPGQKSRLAEHFRAIARGARATKPAQ